MVRSSRQSSFSELRSSPRRKNAFAGIGPIGVTFLVTFASFQHAGQLRISNMATVAGTKAKRLLLFLYRQVARCESNRIRTYSHTARVDKATGVDVTICTTPALLRRRGGEPHQTMGPSTIRGQRHPTYSQRGTPAPLTSAVTITRSMTIL